MARRRVRILLALLVALLIFSVTVAMPSYQAAAKEAARIMAPADSCAPLEWKAGRLGWSRLPTFDQATPHWRFDIKQARPGAFTEPISLFLSLDGEILVSNPLGVIDRIARMDCSQNK